MWRARSDKRHVAATRDMMTIDGRLTAMEDALANLTSKIEKVLEMNVVELQASPQETTYMQIHDIGVRVKRMEVLLCRASLDDYEVLDRKV